MFLEVFFGEVFEVSLGEVNISLDSDSLVVGVHLHVLAEVTGSSCDFDATAEELSEIGGVEDLVLNGLGAVDGEGVRDLGFSGLFSDGFGLGGNFEGGLCLFCGHRLNGLLY